MQKTFGELLRIRMDDLEAAFDKQSQIIKGELLFFKDINIKLDSIIDVMGDEFKERFEKSCDEKRGLKLSSDPIEIGDVAWIVCTIEHNGEKIEQEEIPVRVGSGALVLEPRLVGKKAGESFEFETTFDKGDLAGQTAKYMVTVNKVKTNIHKEVPSGIEAADQNQP